MSADPFGPGGYFLRPGPVTEEELTCPACGHCWYADGYMETGRWWLVDDNDLYCPECGFESAE